MAENIETRPVIGISGANADSASVRAAITQIRSAGAVPLFLGNHGARNPEKDFGKIDALVIMGNNYDVNPAKYGAAKHEKTNLAPDTQRSDYEEAMVLKALAAKMPVLGICGGLHILNTVRKGTLHQHVPDLVGHDEHAQQAFNIAPFVPVQPVIIEPGSTLGKIGAGITAVYTPAHGHALEIVQENSMHHQAVDKVGEGLRAAAYSADKLPDGKLLIEAIEADPNGPLKDQFVLGVQWHPEFGASPLGAKIAASVTQAAQEFARANNRQHAAGEAQDESAFSALPEIKETATGAVMPGSAVDKLMKSRAAAAQTAGRGR